MIKNVFFLCGPTGSGKTSGIAKILIHYAKKEKIRKLLKIITMDTINVGAREVFYNWGGKLMIETSSCATKEELLIELEQSFEKEYIFVDLSGYSMVDENDLQYVNELCKCVKNSKLFFVVPATTPINFLNEMISLQRKIKMYFAGSIITKMDETCSNKIQIILSNIDGYSPIAFINGRNVINSAMLSNVLLLDF